MDLTSIQNREKRGIGNQFCFIKEKKTWARHYAKGSFKDYLEMCFNWLSNGAQQRN